MTKKRGGSAPTCAACGPDRTPRRPGQPYVYVTSNLEVARAFAAQRGNRSVYEVVA